MSPLCIDINCDLGEEAGHDDELLRFISSINIACGAHAGSDAIMQRLVRKAGAQAIAIGAHPGYADREYFGRRNLMLPSADIYQLVFDQVASLRRICVAANQPMQHVKLHGALYNQSASDPVLARAVCDAVYDIDPRLKLFGLSGSLFLTIAAEKGLQPVAEVFADRRYTDEGALVPRSQAGALIDDAAEAVNQVLQMIRSHTVTALSGKTVPVKAETICLHGDGSHAVAFAKQLYKTLGELSISIRPV